MENNQFVPQHLFLTKGVGRHKEKLASFELALRQVEDDVHVSMDGRILHAPFQLDGGRIALAFGEERYAFTTANEIEKASGANAGSRSGAITSPMPGIVAEVKVAAGDQVEAEQVVAVLESMKMNLELLAPQDGVIQELPRSPGVEIGQGDVLAIIGPCESDLTGL